jgi:hypothetical protein
MALNTLHFIKFEHSPIYNIPMRFKGKEKELGERASFYILIRGGLFLKSSL